MIPLLLRFVSSTGITDSPANVKPREKRMLMLTLVLTVKTMLVVPPSLATPQGVAGITRETTPDSLEILFFGETIESTRENLGEGVFVEGTVVSPGTDRELAVIWNDDGTPLEVRMRGAYWRTAEGIGMGSSLVELEAAIGEFEMLGYAWDNEGYALLWETPYNGFFIRLLPRDGESPSEFMGDSAFPSSLLRDLNPVVADFRVRFD